MRGELAADPLSDKTYIEPYRIIEKQLTDGSGATKTIKIGFIGFLPPQIMTWDATNLDRQGRHPRHRRDRPGLCAEDEGRRAPISSSPSPIPASPPDQATGAENASLQVAGVEGIDVVLTGHQHLVFPNSKDFVDIEGADLDKGTLMGKPAVMAGFWGSHMGLIDLLLRARCRRQVVHRLPHLRSPPDLRARRRQGEPTWSKTKPASSPPAKAEHDATLEYVRRAVGETSAPLHSYFALVADDPSVQIVSIAQTWYIAQMMKGTEWESLPILSAAAPFKAGGRGGPDYYTDVPVGPVAIKNVADLYLYPNTIQAVVITGADVKNWLERSAGIFNQIEKGATDAAADQSGFPLLQFRRHRRGHLQDRPHPAIQIFGRRQGNHQSRRQPHRRADV